MAKLRKRPKLADSEKPMKPQAQEVTVELAEPPPVIEYKPPVSPDAVILAPRSPEDIIHNVILRQLADDLKNPPQLEPEDPAMALLKRVQDARDTAQPVAVYEAEANKLLQGLDAEEKLTMMVLRRVRLRKIRRKMEVDEYLDKFLCRLLRRGDLTPKEAIVFKQMNVTELTGCIGELLNQLENRDVETMGQEDFTRMDYTLQVTEATAGKAFANTTPQEREIIRKITIRARRKLYQVNAT